MLILMRTDATRNDIERVVKKIKLLGFTGHEIPGETRVAIGVTGNKSRLDPELFESMQGVAEAVPVTKPYKLAARETRQERSVVQVDGETIGGRELALIAGPCSVETWDQLLETAVDVKAAGAKFLRSGAFKPRSSPYSFQGLKEEGLVMLKEVKKQTGLKIVTEAKDMLTLPAVSEVADLIQIGARNMQNYSLLEAVGDLKKPVLLKRGIAASLEELLLAAEYILARGNYNVVLCERGIRTFEQSTRFTLDLNAIPVLKKNSHLPIIVDPSHGIGMWDGVAPMSMAAIAAGADGLMIEVHKRPEEALSDGFQSLKPERFHELVRRLAELAPLVERTITREKSTR